MKPRLLDLFCGAGGCAKGYQRAGFYVVGIDIEPQPNYCGDEFIQADALAALAAVTAHDSVWFEGSCYDAIHASPPCQGYTSMGQRFPEAQAAHPRLIEDTRRLLEASGLPYVIENVPGARRWLMVPTQICGRGLGLGVGRHRLFECSRFMPFSVACQCDGNELPVYGKLDGRRLWTRVDGSELRAAKTLEEAREAMGIGWMDWDELREAIPPAMTEHIGQALMVEVNRRRLEAAA